MKVIHAVLCTLLLASFGVSAADAPAKAATCVACHGADGNSANPEWPSLAGQNAEYLVRQLNQFRSGQRENALMAPMIAALNDDDVQALAAYYEAQTPRAAASGDSALVAKGQNVAAYCVSCHGGKGKTANPEWPNLAGQQARYMEQQLAAYKSGARQHPHMQTVVQRLNEADMAAVAAYYSQMQP